MPARSNHGTLTASVVTSVTLTKARRRLRIQNHGTGTDRIHYTYGADPAAPTVAGDDTLAVPTGEADEIDVAAEGLGQGDLVVKLICSSDYDFSVETWPA